MPLATHRIISKAVIEDFYRQTTANGFERYYALAVLKIVQSFWSEHKLAAKALAYTQTLLQAADRIQRGALARDENWDRQYIFTPEVKLCTMQEKIGTFQEPNPCDMNSLCKDLEVAGSELQRLSYETQGSFSAYLQGAYFALGMWRFT